MSVTTIAIFKDQEMEVSVVPFSVVPDLEGPAISDIRFEGTPLSDGDAITNSGTLSLYAEDITGVDRVEFFIDGQHEHTETGPGSWFSWFWSLSEADNGSRALSMTAYDLYGNPTTRTLNVIVAVVAPPDPVGPLSVDLEGDGVSANVAWTGYDEEGQGNVAGYRIYAQPQAYSNVEGLDPKAEVSAGLFTVSLNNLERTPPCWIAVVAVGEQGNANPAIVPVSGTPVDIVPPENVSGLAAECFEDRLVFSWNHSADSAGDLAGYHVYFNGSDTPEVLPPARDSFERTELSPAESYPVKIAAFDNDGNESSGRTATGATMLDNPADIATVSSHETVALVWGPVLPSDLVKHYAVYVSQAEFATVEGMGPALTTEETYATMDGLANGEAYWFAVAAVNMANGERKQVAAVSAIPQADTQGPDIAEVAIDGAPIQQGHVVSKAATISAIANDPAGIGRVEFLLDGVLAGTDFSGAPAGFHWDVAAAEDKAYELAIVAYDSFGNSAASEYTVVVALDPPDAPQIIAPLSGEVFNRSSISVSGTAEKKYPSRHFRQWKSGRRTDPGEFQRRFQRNGSYFRRRKQAPGRRDKPRGRRTLQRRSRRDAGHRHSRKPPGFLGQSGRRRRSKALLEGALRNPGGRLQHLPFRRRIHGVLPGRKAQHRPFQGKILL